jgi:hypothetical protein
MRELSLGELSARFNLQNVMNDPSLTQRFASNAYGQIVGDAPAFDGTGPTVVDSLKFG